MAKSVHNDVLDNGPQYLKDNANYFSLCEGEPASYAEASTDKGAGGKRLDSVVVDTTDFTVGDGDVSGRKVEIRAQTGTVEVTGNCDHIAICDAGNSKLLLVTTVTQQTLTLGNTWNTAAFDDEIADPS